MLARFFAGVPESKNEASACHCSQFMVDFVSVYGTSENISNYVAREKAYDLAFCRAWQFLFADAHRVNYNESKEQEQFLIALLDELQAKSLGHLPAYNVVNTGGQIKYQMIHGRVPQYNFYGLVKDWSADEIGVKELALDILEGRKKGFNELVIKNDDPNDTIHILAKNGLYRAEEQPQRLALSTEEILEFIIKTFQKGFLKNGKERLVLYIVNGKERIHREYSILSEYCQNIKLAQTPEEKINVISHTIRNLLQLHLYFDGNARSLFMLANWLLHINDLPLFYPDNMCIFDGNSLQKIYDLIINGQVRFENLFKDEAQLTRSLASYQRIVEELGALINSQKLDKKELDALTNSFESRDFNLMLRQTGASSSAITVLEFLLTNKEILNVDIFAKDKLGKNVFDAAHGSENQEALLILEHYQPEQSHLSSQESGRHKQSRDYIPEDSEKHKQSKTGNF